LVRRNYAATTIRSYLKAVQHFAEQAGVPLEQIGPDDIRSYHVHLLEDRKLAVNTVVLNICALRFLYIKVLKRRHMKEGLPYPKQRLRLPVILSPAEVAQLMAAMLGRRVSRYGRPGAKSCDARLIIWKTVDNRHRQVPTEWP
jgi:site-specific recombinase XerD